MTKTKTGLMYSELTSNVYYGTMNAETGIARGNKKDVTSDFIGVMLQKFPINFKQNIECNGKLEAEIIVLGPENKNRHRFPVAKDMEDMLQNVIDNVKIDNMELHNSICDLLAKARGESPQGGE